MKLIMESWRGFLVEKELRGQKDKRVMYHIGRRPASPKPAERWGEKGGWTRSWMDGPVPSGVFMTPNPTDVVQHHGVSGNVYAYRVPEWVINKAGGKQRFDSAGELLISQELWDEAGDEIEFMGKSMSQQDLWDSVDSSYYSARQRKGKRAKHNKPAKFTLSGLRMTSDPEAVIKMMKPHERKKVWAQLEDKYPVAMKGEEFEVEWEKQPEERKGWRKDFLLGEPRMSKSNKIIMDLLKKHMNESLAREYTRRVLSEISLPSIQWVDVNLASLESKDLDRIWSMYTNTYLSLGMDLSASSAAGLTKYKAAFLIDVDDPPDGIPDAFIIYKPTAFGNKISLLGTCQEELCLNKRAAKSALVRKMFDLLNSGGFFIEAGEKIEVILRSSSVPPVCDQEKIMAFLGKKFVRFLDDCYYQRKLKMASAIVTKRIYGSFG